MAKRPFARAVSQRRFRMHRQTKRGNLKDLHWQVPDRLQLPKGRAADLLDAGSLTQRLVRASGGDFSVKVLKQSWQRPDFTERRRLRLADDAYAFIREVHLVCRGQVWVIARSVIPAKTLTGSARRLRYLGSRPLGATLFKNPALSRTLFEVCCLSEKQLPISSKIKTEGALWGRRSIFCLHKQPLLVSEIFLPECPDLHLF